MNVNTDLFWTKIKAQVADGSAFNFKLLDHSIIDQVKMLASKKMEAIENLPDLLPTRKDQFLHFYIMCCYVCPNGIDLIYMTDEFRESLAEHYNLIMKGELEVG